MTPLATPVGSYHEKLPKMQTLAALGQISLERFNPLPVDWFSGMGCGTAQFF